MSRIHDALKKAEQEKLLGGAAPGVLDADAPLGSGDEAQEHAPLPSNGDTKGPSDRVAGSMEATVEEFLETCPRLDWNTDPSLTEQADAYRNPLVSEEFRSLRARLYLMRERKSLRKLLITSPLPREGKTFLAANLAWTFARQQDSRVLLIDTDLRVSALHKIIGARLAPGLSEYLAGAVELNSVLQRSTTGNLFFIAAGERPQNPAELLANARIERLMNRLAPAFDWIILDSPPAVPVSDARLLAQFCDGVLMLIQAGVTPSDLAIKACQEFSKGQVLGVILNRAEAQPGYGYYYYYGEGSTTAKAHTNE